MSNLIISVSGLRGVIGEDLNPEVAARFVGAYAQTRPAGPIVLSRDGRSTGRMLADSVRATLCALGRDVIDCDVAATPTLGVLVRHFQASGAVQISASHNPPQYNGIKLFQSDGQVLDAQAGQQVVDLFQAGQLPWKSYEAVGQVCSSDTDWQIHGRTVLRQVNVARIQSRRFTVLLDSNHGAGSILGQWLLEQLGCEVILKGGTPNGQFAHPPEPTADNLKGVLADVVAEQADVGFCQDPDADRLAVIDEQGVYIGEELTLALCLDHVLRQTPGPVVINCATSQINERIAEKYACPIHRSAVGEANVVAMMKQQKAVFGGEGNGGPIDPRVGYVRDSFVGMALILDALAERGQSLSQWTADLPQSVIHKSKVDLTRAQVEAAIPTIQAHFPDAEFDTLDGIRLTWPDRWLLLRASNTEPIVRIIAEAEQESGAKQLAEEARTVLAGSPLAGPIPGSQSD